MLFILFDGVFNPPTKHIIWFRCFTSTQNGSSNLTLFRLQIGWENGCFFPRGEDPSKCPVEGKCLTKGVIYQAIVKQTLSGHEESYCGLTDSSFKLRFDGHNNSFRHEKYKTKTTLSSHIWDLKSKHIDFELSWRILSKARSYSPSNKICNLCNREAYFIIYL